MKTCIMCSKEVSRDDGYATDGKIFVCDNCASRYSLWRIITRISNLGVDANLIRVWEPPIEVNSESGLVDQTTPNVELDKSRIDERTGFTIPNGCSKDCPHWPFETCGHYYGEGHMCMLDEEEIAHDIDNMSPEDFLSKYCDNPTAIAEYMDKHPEVGNTY